jgi:class 3 adenylate cyclase
MKHTVTLTLATALICCVTLVTARQQYIGTTNTPLLGGSTLTACNAASVNLTGCTAGMAVVAYKKRRYQALYGVTPTVIPYIDRQTAFVQMYPVTWAVNPLIFSYLGFQDVTTAPSLFTSDDRTGWEYFQNTSNFFISFANVLMAPLDKWFPNHKTYTIHEGIAFIVLDSNSLANTVDPFATITNLLSSFKMLNTVNGSIVYFSSTLVTATAIYNSIGSVKPDVIFASVGSAGSIIPTYKIGNTFIVSVYVAATTISMVNLTVDDITGKITNASGFVEDIATPVGTTGDALYYEQQAVMDSYAAGANNNDPIVGSSGAMPVMRNGNFRLCIGGECPGGRLYAESMRFVEGTDVAMTSSGAFRGSGWPAGTFKISDVWSVSPFANQVCHGTLRGVSLYAVLNFSTALTTAPVPAVSALGDRLLQTGGIKIVFNNLLNYTRIISVHILNKATGLYEKLEATKLYTYACDSYLANTFSPYPSMLTAHYDGEVSPVCSTVNLMQTEVVTYMANISYFNTTNQGTLLIDNTTTAVFNLIQVQSDCAAGTIWVASLGACVDCPAGLSSPPGSVSCAAESKSDITKTIAIAVPVGAVGLALIIAYFVYSEREKRKNQRNIDNAPKSGEVVLMFTDIQDSTKLWGTCPASMSLSLDHHHRIIRDCIAEYKGYEVKTVGDCFMIASSNVEDAISLALAIQDRLQKQEFPKAIAAVYACKNEDDLDAVEDNAEDLAELDPLFNGLRVRIGMHCGVPDCVFDEVTRGYDYYGPPVNVAARVESTAKGGQINASRDLVSRISDQRTDIEVVFFNAVELKGVAGLTEILHIVPKNLTGRVAIYQQMAKDEKSESSTEESATDDTRSMMSGGINQQDAELIRKFVAYLAAAIKVMKPKAQHEVVRSMMKAWRVKVPSKELPIEDEIKLFAGRATKGIKRAEALLGGMGGMGASMRRTSVLSTGLEASGKEMHIPVFDTALPQHPESRGDAPSPTA